MIKRWSFVFNHTLVTTCRYPNLTFEDIGVEKDAAIGQLNDWINAYPEMANNGQSNNIETMGEEKYFDIKMEQSSSILEKNNDFQFFFHSKSNE